MNYNIAYIKKNLDLKLFIKYLSSLAVWSPQDDDYHKRIIYSAIYSCINKKNKDINIKPDNKKIEYREHPFLVGDKNSIITNSLEKIKHKIEYECFYPLEYIKLDSGAEVKWKPTKKQKENFSKFQKELKLLMANGKLLLTISNNFKLIYNINKSMYGDKDDKALNSLYHSKIDNKHYYVWYARCFDDVNEIVKTFKKKLTKNEFIDQIDLFTKSRG